jgi:SH3-like domain-containing protein
MGPSTEEEVLTVLTLGTPVFPEGRDLEWILVRTVAGPVGWVHESLLR